MPVLLWPCLLQNVNQRLCLSASDSQTVLWCRYWWFDRSSTTHQHQAATLTTASSGCINGKVWRTVAKQTHASDITTHDGVLYQLCYCSSAFRKCWEQASNFVPALTALLSLTMVYSCYSILLLKYLSECKRQGRECHIRAVLLISTIWDLKATDDIIHQPLNKYTLNRHLSNNFKGILRE